MVEIQSGFVVQAPERLIRFGAEVLNLDAVEYEVLARLIERAGRSLTSSELLAALEPLGVVEQASLWAAVVRINQALAACAEEAGYVLHTPEAGFALRTPQVRVDARNLEWTSRRITSVIGRAESIELLGWQLSSRRFVTIVGPGGIGKTTLALATAQARREAYADGVRFVDLSPLDDERLVPSAVAGALGMPMADLALDLRAYLQGRQLLLVLDSCEHMLGAVAPLIESFLSDAPQVHVLVTSREPLRALGEWVHRLEPMRLPARADALTASEASAYSGVQLFVERVQAGAAGFELNDEIAPAVAELCIKLDGMPLALELAAARVPLLGVRGVITQIEGRLLLMLGGGPRRRPQRHRTLEALLDWSHDLLSAEQQCVFRQLAVFRGHFSLAAAVAVIGQEESLADGPGGVTELILDLAAKSLLTRVTTEGEPALRLLDTTRTYAAAKLALDPHRSRVYKRHAQVLRAVLIEAEADWERLNRREWNARYGIWVSDVRAALDWAFATPGEDELALQLTNLALPLAEQTALMTEYGEWADRALEVLPRLQDKQPVLEIRLRMLPVLNQQREPADAQVFTARMHEVLQLAQAHGEPKCQAGPLLGLWGTAFQNGAYLSALKWSQRMREVGEAEDDPFLQLISKRTEAQTSHYLGNHALAETRAKEVLASAHRRVPWAYFPSPVDIRVSMRIVRVRVLWMQGRPREATEVVESCLQIASTDTLVGLSHSLGMAAVPLALWCGDIDLARRRNQQLRELETSHSFRYWRPWWQAYEEILASWSSGADLPTVRNDLSVGRPLKLREQLVSIDARWSSEDLVERVESGAVGWCAPEVWRAQGEAALADPALAEGYFQRALQVAREQGATAWELRAALSLSDLWQSQGRAEDAHQLLSGVRQRFTDDYPTSDLAAADSRLQAWAMQP